MSHSQSTASPLGEADQQSDLVLHLVVDNEVVFTGDLTAVPSIGSRFYALGDAGPVYAEVTRRAWTLAAHQLAVAAIGKRLDGPRQHAQQGDDSGRHGAGSMGPQAGRVRVHVRTDDDTELFVGELPAVPEIGDDVLGYLEGDPSGVVIKVTEQTWYLHPAQGGPAVEVVGERYTGKDTVPAEVQSALDA